MFFVIDGKLREGECNFLRAIESANSTIQIIMWKILTPNLVGRILECFPSSGYLNVLHSVYMLSIKRMLCNRAAPQNYLHSKLHILVIRLG